MKREDEQNRLAQQQRDELEQLAEWQRQLQEERQLAEENRIRELQERANVTTDLVQRDTRELEALRRRSGDLDSNNRELHTQLAQADQTNRILEDKLNLLKQQLRDTAEQLASAIQQKDLAEERMGQMRTASSRQPIGARITANSSLSRNLTALAIPGINVRQDADVVRIELPSDTLFAGKSATINPNSLGLVAEVANAIATHYPQQIIGVEAHTDNDPVPGGQWRSNHQLSAAQATAIFDQLVQQHRLPPDQMFVLGHGGNRGVVPNTTPAGKARNRRVEIVVYPETITR
jgi:chemotaxis protein MotB